ncbi:MAG: hypothetical protein WA960_00535 [Tunicatimonas sp.]
MYQYKTRGRHTADQQRRPFIDAELKKALSNLAPGFSPGNQRTRVL